MVYTRHLVLCACVCAAIAAFGCDASEKPSAPGRVRVAAAADLNVALEALIARFRQSHDVDVTVSYGSSDALYAQILSQGAPFDLFLSADLHFPNELVARGMTLPQTEFTYAVGRGGVILKSSADPEAARALRRFVLSADGRTILERSRFALPDAR
jgi:ABC-type molybdate transport system substrate-binding protein